MKDFPSTPRELVTSLWRNRELIKITAKREIVGRYKGSIMGLLWSFFNPVFLLAIYTFVFSEIFKARWTSNSESKTEFALLLFAGLIVFNLFSECLNRAPYLIISNVNYVKKVLYPLESIAVVGLISALFHAAVSLIVWLVAYTIFFGIPKITIFYIPFVMFPFCLLVLGISWALASLGVYLRDIAQMIVIMTTAIMFVSPIFYPISSLPLSYQKLLYLNPLTTVIEQMRDVLYFGRTPNFTNLLLYWLAASFVSWGGFVWFQKTRKGFADVL